ncbi:MAG: GNAT family N-acetyltransferase [Rhodanobacteraceae bacterium]
MAMHALDNPVWESLASHHSALALKTGCAARYPGEVAPFIGVKMAEVGAASDAAMLVGDGESVLFVGPAPPLSPSSWSTKPAVLIAQMTCDSHAAINDGPKVTRLTSPAQISDMLALTKLVYPHYFRPRTVEMGRYFGIYDGDRLVAMAGERMGFGEYRELSAICTHPDHTGRGFAQRLTAMLNNDVLDRGRRPFLHVSHKNTRAIALYERLGYRFRADIPLVAATRLAGSSGRP